MPFCLHCTKETDQRCVCCPATHYCSKECQREDWYSVHKFERHVYQIGKKESTVTERPLVGLPGKENATKEKGQSAVAWNEVEASRAEYTRLVSCIQDFLANRPLTKREMRQTHRQRADMQRNVKAFVIDHRAAKLEENQKFLNEVTKIIESANAAATESGTESLRRIELDSDTMAQISQLFRKRALLHLKTAYALLSEDRKDSEESIAYRDQVIEQERRFIHALLFRDLPGVTYEATVAKERETLRDALLDEHVRNVFDQVAEESVAVGMRYLAALDREEKKKSPLAEDKNIKNMFTAINNDPVALAHDISRYNYIAEVVLGHYAAKTEKSRDDGEISAEVCENSCQFANKLWQTLSERLSGMLEETRTESMHEAEEESPLPPSAFGPRTGQAARKSFVSMIYDSLAFRWGDVKLLLARVKHMHIATLVCTLVFGLFLTFIFGDRYFRDSYIAEVSELLDQLYSAGTYLSRVMSELLGLDKTLSALDVATKNFTKLINNPTGIVEFTQIPAWNSAYNLDAFDIRFLVHKSIHALLETIEAAISQQYTVVTDTVTGVVSHIPVYAADMAETFALMRKLANHLLACPTLSECRVTLQRLISLLVGLGDFTAKIGLTVLTSDVRGFLQNLGSIASTLDIQVDSLCTMVSNTTAIVANLSGAAELKRASLEAAAMKAQFFGSLLTSFAANTAISGLFMSGLMQTLASTFFTTVETVPLTHSYMNLLEYETTYRRMANSSGLWRQPNSTSIAVSMGLMLTQGWDTFDLVKYALFAVSLATPIIGSTLYVLFSVIVGGLMRAAMTSLAKCFKGDVIDEDRIAMQIKYDKMVAEYEAALPKKTAEEKKKEEDEFEWETAAREKEDANRMQQALLDKAAELFGESNSVRYVLTKVTSRVKATGEIPDGKQYAILLELITRQAIVAPGNLWLTRFSTQIESVGAALRLVCLGYLFWCFVLLVIRFVVLIKEHFTYIQFGYDLIIPCCVVVLFLSAMVRDRLPADGPLRFVDRNTTERLESVIRLILRPGIGPIVALNAIYFCMQYSGALPTYTYRDISDWIYPGANVQINAMNESRAFMDNYTATLATLNTTAELAGNISAVTDNVSNVYGQMAIIANGTYEQVSQLDEYIAEAYNLLTSDVSFSLG